MNRTLEAPLFEMPTEPTLRLIEEEINEFNLSRRRCGGAAVRMYEFGNEVAFLIRYGGLRSRGLQHRCRVTLYPRRPRQRTQVLLPTKDTDPCNLPPAKAIPFGKPPRIPSGRTPRFLWQAEFGEHWSECQCHLTDTSEKATWTVASDGVPAQKATVVSCGLLH
jgi:hypothetical protein